MRSFQTRVFLGVTFTPMDLETATSVIAERPAEASFAFVVTPNAQHVVAAHGGDRRFAEGQARAWLVLNDSRILRLLSRLLFRRDLPLAVGSDLAARLFERVIRPDTAVTLIGGDAALEAELTRRFGLSRLARHDPPFGFGRDPIEVRRCVDFVRDHPARFVFLIAGAPQSEQVAMQLSQTPGVTGVGLCVGSALNFLTGRVRRAPVWVRAANLEWAWRLALNPAGHARRVFVESAPVLWLALRERMRPQTS